MMGYFYQEGKYIERDIKKSIHHYKEASSFNDQFAKNNLGIIYKNGICEIAKNIGYAIEYFDESIRRFGDRVCMYNLAHIYIYEEGMKESIDKSIDLLIRSINLQFSPSNTLLMIAMIKKCGFNLTDIKKCLIEKTSQSSNLPNTICQMIQYFKFDNESVFQKAYDIYKTIDYMYDYSRHYVISILITNQIFNQQGQEKKRDISDEFYEGFGKDVL